MHKICIHFPVSNRFFFSAHFRFFGSVLLSSSMREPKSADGKIYSILISHLIFCITICPICFVLHFKWVKQSVCLENVCGQFVLGTWWNINILNRRHFVLSKLNANQAAIRRVRSIARQSARSAHRKTRFPMGVTLSFQRIHLIHLLFIAKIWREIKCKWISLKLASFLFISIKCEMHHG